jgi:hypothetical protein
VQVNETLAGPLIVVSMISFDIQSPQSSSVVLAALRARAGEWHESQIPTELRKAGVFGIESRVDGATLTLRYERSWYGLGARGQFLRARATVYSAGSGAKVHVAVDYHPWGLTFSSIVASAAVLSAFLIFFGINPWAFFLVLFPLSIMVASLALSRYMSQSISRSDPDADYLVRRIEYAILGTPVVLAG